ncbi:class I SAM-dependent methyltransferase [Streptomyces sp. enrichment culture]|uniref:class I SAM-dependent methyltransferase n=1 Tax=Streptomyces sp. enrichment culture TaxID=1795815 RepID=UPI003F54A772
MSRSDEDVANLLRWDEAAALHLESPFYAVPDVISGKSSLSSIDSALLSKLTGRVLHPMCHIGTDTVSLAQTFSRVVGFDYSEKAVRIAQQISARRGSRHCTFAVGDITRMPVASSSFDVVFLNWGSLVWIFDLPSVLRDLRRALRPGGHLVIVDQHPASLTFRRGNPPSTMVPTEHYFGNRKIVVNRKDYAERTATVRHGEVIEARHTMSEILHTVLREFRLLEFQEYESLSWQAYADMVASGHRLWKKESCPVPLSFSIVAQRQ